MGANEELGELEEIGEQGNFGWYRMDNDLLWRTDLPANQFECLILSLSIAHDLGRKPEDIDIKIDMSLPMFKKMKASLLAYGRPWADVVANLNKTSKRGWFKLDINLFRYTNLSPNELKCLVYYMALTHELGRLPNSDDMKKISNRNIVGKLTEKLKVSQRILKDIAKELIENKKEMEKERRSDRERKAISRTNKKECPESVRDLSGQCPALNKTKQNKTKQKEEGGGGSAQAHENAHPPKDSFNKNLTDEGREPEREREPPDTGREPFKHSQKLEAEPMALACFQVMWNSWPAHKKSSMKKCESLFMKNVEYETEIGLKELENAIVQYWEIEHPQKNKSHSDWVLNYNRYFRSLERFLDNDKENEGNPYWHKFKIAKIEHETEVTV